MPLPPPLPTSAPTAASPLALLRQLEWRVRHAVENTLGGEYRSAFRGRGMEFDQVVKYEFGDDVRDIDWNVTARLGEPYRKKFVEERELTVMLVLEDTLSLQFGSAAQSKREALLELAGLVMLLGAVNRDRVGFLHLTPTGHTLRHPVRGRGPIHHAAASLLSTPAPSLNGSAPATLNLQLSTSRLLLPTLPRHSILICLGDFAPRVAPEGWAVLQKRYQPMGFRIDDPWDRALPSTGPFNAYDPVTGQLVTVENSSAQRAAHAQWRAARDASFHAQFPDPLSRLSLLTTDNRLDALVRFFRRRT